MLGGIRPSLQLVAPLVALLLLACSSDEPHPPQTPEELRDRVWTALRGDGDQVLHLQTVRPEVGGFELIRETWVEWSTDSIRQAYYGNGDEAPLTLVVRDRQYYPPAVGYYPLSTEVGGRAFEPIEVLWFPLFFLSMTDETATVTESTVDGDRVWRLEQSDMRAEEDGEELFCVDVRLDFDAITDLPRAVSAADCGDPLLSGAPISASLIDRDALPGDFFSPDAVRVHLLAPALDALRSAPVTIYWLGDVYEEFRLDSVIPWQGPSDGPGASFRYRPEGMMADQTIELFVAPASSPIDWSCDALASVEPDAVRVEVIEGSSGRAEACLINGELAELRLTIGQTSILITGSGLPRPDLLAVAEALRRLESAP